MNVRKLIPLLVITAALLAYHNSFRGEFVSDDALSILENPTIRQLWPIWQCLSPPQWGGLTVEGRPLINLSLAINYALGGYNVWGYHAFNLTVHILAGLTLLGIVRRTLLQPRLRTRFGASADGLALATALIWTLHPLQTESVTYVIQRAESMMGLFYLLTLYCFIREAESVPVRRSVGTRCSASQWPRGSAALPSALWFTLSVVACALGMVSKEVMVSAPLMVLLYDRAFLSDSFRESWRRRWLLYLALASTWILLGIVVLSGQLPTTAMSAHRIGLKWWEYLATEPGVILHYLRLSAWPSPLCLDHGWPIARTWVSILPSALVLGILLGASVWAWKIKSPWGFVGAWFFIILAPSSSVIPLQDAIHEHRMYLPLAAVISLAVIGLYLLTSRSKFGLAGRSGLAVLAVVAVGLGFLTWRRNRDYRDEITIRLDAVAKFPNDPVVHYNFGVALARLGRMPEAIEQFDEALRLRPDFAWAHYSLAVALGQLGRVPEAIEQFERTIQVQPDYAEAHNNFGVMLAGAGRTEEAIGHFEQVLRIRPDDTDAHNNLGAALAQAGRLPEAIEQFDLVVRIKPDAAEAHYNLAAALEQAGRVPEAIGHYEQAVRLDHDFTEAQNRLTRLRARE